MMRAAILTVITAFAFLSAPLAHTQEQVPTSQTQINLTFAPLVKTVAPAVVNVYAARQVTQRRSPFAGDPFFERFFGNRGFGGQEQRRRTAQSLGSGVIVDDDGIVITNVHVVRGADEVRVALRDGREFEAEILLADERSDLAVLKVDADEPLPTAPLGDSEALEVGDLVLALGNPFGVGQTVTSGIVSALARSQNGVNDFGFFIQTDASINPGNSGGALVNMRGDLVGINTAIFSRSGGSNGIGFAVPSNMVRVVLDSARAGASHLIQPWIGATFQAVTPDIASSLGMARPSGALIINIEEDSPAEEAGLSIGDVILTLDDKMVPHMEGLGYRLATAGIGRKVKLGVISHGKTVEAEIELREAPEEPARETMLLEDRSPFSGLQVMNLSPRVAQEVGLPTDKRGVVITKVENNTAAARFGFRPKDILREVRDVKIEKTGDLAAITRLGGRAWTYTMERDGRQFRQFIR
jgi:Do/DeqQ family serine protease